MTVGDRSVIRFARGARRAEALLIDEALTRSAELGRRLALDHPVQIVVPSHSLREHLLSRLAAVAGRSLIGVRCTTHRALALQILQNSGIQPPEAIFNRLAEVRSRREGAM